MAKIELEDIIAAIATPVGEGGISVIRLSGPGALDFIQPFFISSGKKELKHAPANTILWGKFVTSEEKVIDQVLISLFHAPHSYTGQDVVEISCHGGLAVTRRILNVLLEKGARHAEPGEFTRRAFLNGKIDLTQAEAVLDLIHAKSSRSLDIAVRQLSGSLSQSLKGLKEELMRLLAHMEAYIDFPEEGLENNEKMDLQKQFTLLRERIHSLIQGFQKNILIREGVLVTLVGKPNVGKSSLFNALLERDRALVSELPYTTRDHLEEPLEIKGFYIRLRDTAGLISTPEHPLDKLGMERTLQAIQESHAVLFVVDGSRPLEDADRHVFEKIPKEKRIITLMNKADLPMNIKEAELHSFKPPREIVKVSAKSREGLKDLEQKIVGFLEQETSEAGEQITKLRHKIALEAALEALARAEAAFQEKISFEFVTLDIRVALDTLKELTGEIYSEDLLDVIFSEFCIGK